MPTRFMGASTFGGCDYDKLYVLTAQFDADILTGTAVNTTVVEPPGGSLLVFHGIGKGQQQRKPCIGC